MSTATELEQWSTDSRDPAQVADLLDRQIPQTLAVRLAQHATELATAGPGVLTDELRHSLLHMLRTLRNLCACGEPAVAAVTSSGAAGKAASVMSRMVNMHEGARSRIQLDDIL